MRGQPAAAVGAAAAAPEHADDGQERDRPWGAAAVGAAVDRPAQRRVRVQAVEEDVQPVAEEEAECGGDDGGQGAVSLCLRRGVVWEIV